jgi:hypothetical protein
MKRKILFSILITGFVFITAGCSESEDVEDLAKKAAIEFCNCYETKSKDDCLEELKRQYKASDYMNSSFIETFNKVQDCYVELEIIPY